MWLTYEEACKMSIDDLLDKYHFNAVWFERFHERVPQDSARWTTNQLEEHTGLIKERHAIVQAIKERCGEE